MIYFGCHGGPGHYTWGPGMRRLVQRYGSRDFTRFDGMLPSQTDTTPYVATLSRLGGWGMSALAFWDYSVDSRGGCNSVFFLESLTVTPGDFLEQAQAKFPEVFRRLPRPLQIPNYVEGT